MMLLMKKQNQIKYLTTLTKTVKKYHEHKQEKKTEEHIREEVLEKLERVLTGSTGLKYGDLKPGKKPTDLAIQNG